MTQFASTSRIPDDEDIDYTDIEEKYQVPEDDTFDNVVVVDNVPIVEVAKRDRLLNAIAKKFTQKGAPIKQEALNLPWDDAQGKSKGCVDFRVGERDPKLTALRYLFIEFGTPEEANNAIAIMDRFPFDAKHTFLLNRFTDIDRFITLNEQYKEPEFAPYKARVHLSFNSYALIKFKSTKMTGAPSMVASRWKRPILGL